jgi:hypothetical protein
VLIYYTTGGCCFALVNEKRKEKKSVHDSTLKKKLPRRKIFLHWVYSTVQYYWVYYWVMLYVYFMCIMLFAPLAHMSGTNPCILSFYTVLYVRYIANTVRSFFSLLSRRPNDQRKEQKRKETTAEPAIHQHSMYCMRI